MYPDRWMQRSCQISMYDDKISRHYLKLVEEGDDDDDDDDDGMDCGSLHHPRGAACDP